MDYNDKKEFQQAIDTTLSGLQGNPFLYQRVAAHAEKGEQYMRYKMPKGLVIAVVLILCMATVAMAASLYGGSINWLGERIEDEKVGEALPTVAPPPADASLDETEEIVMNAAETYERPGEMLVITSTMGDGTIVPTLSRGVISEVNNEAELYALLGADSLLPRPSFIPEGYEFVRGKIFYDCHASGSYELIAQHDMTAGVTVHRYRIRSGDEFPNGYYLFFRSSQEDYHYIAITVQLTQEQDLNNQRFGYLAGQTAQIVMVPGMDTAMAITGDHTSHLTMRRILPERIDYIEYQDLVPCQQEYAEVEVSISAPLLDTDTLVQMFTSD